MFQVQKKIAFIMASIGLLVSIVNLINGLSQETIIQGMMHSTFYLVFLLSAYFFLTAFLNNGIIRLTQVLFLFFAGIMAILDEHNSIHGVGFIILAVFLSFKYGYFKKRPVVKLILVISAAFVAIVISAGLANKSNWMVGFNAVLFLSMFLFISYIIYQDEIKEYLEKSRNYDTQIDKLLRQRAKLNDKIDDYKEKYKAIDFEKYNLTPREIETIKVLVLYRESDQMLADRLNISINTLRDHLRHIRDKMGVDTRLEIVELCRYNFL
ncbi:MAG: LuxR C-terminal-related transcriptional regulator [Spirochaetia bacterium]|nr:LuxR C-terminal-related transcriptional regulator [Spirochaetia bacterium]